MNLVDFKNTKDINALKSDHLRALWLDLNGNWEAAHNIVQVLKDHTAMWIHAYLHRKEPDIWNAKYWYRRIWKPYPGLIDFEIEAAEILEKLV